MSPKVYNFRDMGQYAEWLPSHSDEVPEVGEVLIFKFHAENLCWVKVGNGKTKVADLPTIE